MHGLLAIIRDEDETCQCFDSRCERKLTKSQINPQITSITQIQRKG